MKIIIKESVIGGYFGFIEKDKLSIAASQGNTVPELLINLADAWNALDNIKE